MTFLQLVTRSWQEMGISGDAPTTVVSQTGEKKRVVDWVANAYRDICDEKEEWRFLRSAFTVNTVSGTEDYLPSDCTDSKLSAAITADSFAKWVITKFDTFRIYLTANGSDNQQQIWNRDFQWFRYQYQLQSRSDSQPIEFAIRDEDEAILLGPTPNDVYTVTGEYYRVAPDLALDADVPLFPARFHLAIVWRALRSYARYEEDTGLYVAADIDYKRVYGSLKKNQLPKMTLGGPMA